MLTIVVGAVRENIVTADDRHMKVFPMLVERDGKYCAMQASVDFTQVQEVEMFALRWFMPFYAQRIKLTSVVQEGIVKFLHGYHAKENLFFNCYSFACLVNGVDWRDGQGQWRKSWDVQPYRRRRRVGDVVFLISNEKWRFHHAAIYIGCGLYLSVYGGGGDLEVATLKDMKRDYEAPDVVLVTPRQFE